MGKRGFLKRLNLSKNSDEWMERVNIKSLKKNKHLSNMWKTSDIYSLYSYLSFKSLNILHIIGTFRFEFLSLSCVTCHNHFSIFNLTIQLWHLLILPLSLRWPLLYTAAYHNLIAHITFACQMKESDQKVCEAYGKKGFNGLNDHLANETYLGTV